MLLFSLFASTRLKEAAPSLTGALILGNLLGTLSIPILFYTYTGITGPEFLHCRSCRFLHSSSYCMGRCMETAGLRKSLPLPHSSPQSGCPYVPFVLHLHFSRTGSSSVPCMKQMPSRLHPVSVSRPEPNSYQQDDSTLRKPAHRRNSPQVHHGSPYNTRPAASLLCIRNLVQSCSPAAG